MKHSIDHILGVSADGSDSRKKAIGRLVFVLAWLGLWAVSLTGLLRGMHELVGPIRIEIQVGKKAPAPLERPEARSTFQGKVNTMKVREEYRGVKQGATIGRRTVLGPLFRLGKNSTWFCVTECRCGVVAVAQAMKMAAGLANSCGCLAVDVTVARDSMKSYRALYRKWDGMRQRCYNPRTREYPNYGGRGITVCDEWRERGQFVAFRDWALANGWKNGLDIDRIDNSKGYSPGNCRFISRKANLNNRRITKLLTAFGETKPLTEWLNDPRCVVGENTIRKRIYILKWADEKSLSTPAVDDKRFVTAFGETKTVEEWSRDDRCQVTATALRRRLFQLGWEAHRALETPRMDHESRLKREIA